MTNEQMERRKAIVGAITSANYGDVFEHDELLRISGIEDKNSKAYRYMMAAVKRECEKAGKALIAIPGTGYRIITPGEYSVQAARRARLGMNQINKGVRLLQHAPVEQMTADERGDYNTVAGGLNAIAGAVSMRTAEVEVAARRALMAAQISG